MRIDLHTHSDRSDGTDTPAELVRKAAQEARLDVVALTDHDATTGWEEALEAGRRHGIRVIPGIEISTRHRGESVHLLGYAFDADHPPLVAELQRVRDGRDERLPLVLEKLAEHDIHISEDDVAAVSGSAAASGRPHIADAMVAKGYLSHRDEAFDGWLNQRGRAYVPRYAADLGHAVRLVTDAGGRAVVAHAWSRSGRRVLGPADFARLQEAGLAGIEVDHPDHDAAARKALTDIADELGLVRTGSSDHHGAGKSADFALGIEVTDPEQFERLEL